PGMKGRDGRRLEGRVVRPIRVGPPDHESPDIFRWRLAATANRLEIECDEWLDHAGLEEFIRVDGVPGRCRVEGRRITFVPERGFAPGEYRLMVDARLEDLAGNNFIKPFETPSGQTPLPADRPAMVVRTFAVRSGE